MYVEMLQPSAQLGNMFDANSCELCPPSLFFPVVSENPVSLHGIERRKMDGGFLASIKFANFQ